MRVNFSHAIMLAATLLLIGTLHTDAYAEMAEIPLNQAGHVASIEFKSHKCQVFKIDLRFHTMNSTIDVENDIIGGPAYNSTTKQFLQPGIVVPLKIRIVKLESQLFGQTTEKEIMVIERETQGRSGRGGGKERILIRAVALRGLPRGKYRAEVSILKPVPEFNNIPVTLHINPTYKFKPNKDECI